MSIPASIHDPAAARRPARRRWLGNAAALCAVLLLAACGSSVEENVGEGGGGGGGSGGGGGGDPGSGGGGRSGGRGEALQISPHFVVQNAHDTTRTETVLASIPFPEGMIADLSGVGVSGHATAWMPMQKWPDGSVKVALAEFTVDIPATSTAEFDVVRGVTPETGAFEPNNWVANWSQPLRVRCRATDGRDKQYWNETDLLGTGEVLHETPLRRVRRIRLYHQPQEAGCIPRDFLTSTLYVQEHRDMPIVTVDWLVGNDYKGIDDPQGNTDPNLYPLLDVDVNEVSIDFANATEVRAVEPDWHAVQAPVTLQNGARRFVVMQNDWIGDGQTRRYRFHVRVEPQGAAANEAQRWRDTFEARVEAALYPLCDLRTWQLTHALGIHGGPVDPPADIAARITEDLRIWRGRDHFGTWGTFGDTIGTGTSGTPRNGPVQPESARAIQGASRDIFIRLEKMAWAQAVRPYHLWQLTIGAEEDLYLYYPTCFPRGTGRTFTRETLGRAALWENLPWPELRTRTNYRAHGWNGYDENHWTTDILFDYWTLTGDAWAKEELRQLGESLKGMLRLVRYPTRNIRNARGEGWCMVGFVQAYLATGDEAIKDYARRRITEVIEPQRWKDHVSRTMRSYGPDPRTGWGMEYTFFPPWEHAPVILGMLGAHKYFEAPEALKMAEDVVHLIDYSWISDYTHPGTGQYYAHAIRYWTPLQRVVQGGTNVDLRPDVFDADPTRGAYIPSSPLGSVNEFFVSALDILHGYTEDAQIQARIDWQLDKLYPEPTDWRRWNKWMAVMPRTYSNQRQ